jgi:probable rRNA maturation factor
MAEKLLKCARRGIRTRAAERASSPPKQLIETVKSALRRLKIKNSTADVFVLNGRDLARLKAEYSGRKVRKFPDVLAFREPKGFPHPERGEKVLGEIYLNKDIMRRDSRRAVFLLIHGLLHLLGYTHNKKNDTLKMERLEEKIINKLF